MRIGKRIKQAGLWLVRLILFAAQPVYAAPGRAEFTDVYRAKRFRPDIRMRSLGEKLGRTWDFSGNSGGNFTHFSGMTDQRVDDGKLAFTLTDAEAVLGWGNYRGVQGKEERTYLWPMENVVQMRVRQTVRESTWHLTLWRDGTGESIARYFRFNEDEVQVTGTGWQIVQFEAKTPGSDGFELRITGSPVPVLKAMGFMPPFSYVRLAEVFSTVVPTRISSTPDAQAWLKRWSMSAVPVPCRRYSGCTFME